MGTGIGTSAADVSAARARRRYKSSAEWYTPDWLLSRIAAFYGGTYFDPCPASDGHLGSVENGLALPWRGRAFVNPPYGHDIAPWIRKAVTEPVKELLLLVPVYTDTKWFAPLFAARYPMCFLYGRLVFRGPSQTRDTCRAPGPSVLVYRGRRVAAFGEAFSDLGPIVRQTRAMRSKQPTLMGLVAGEMAVGA